MFHQNPLLGQQINWTHPLAKGLASCWLMNEGSGNKTFDLSGGFNGTFVGGPVWSNNKGSVIEFDGTNDKVSIGNTLPTLITDGLTIAASIRIDGYGDGSYGRIYDDGKNIWFVITPTTWKYTSNGGGTDSTSGAGAYVLGKWVFATITRAPGSLTVNSYSNGVLLNSASGGAPAAGTDGHIGGRAAGGRPFDGAMEFVYVYNRDLSLSEINQLYRDPYAMFEPEPIWVMVNAAAGEYDEAIEGILPAMNGESLRKYIAKRFLSNMD